MTEMPVFNDLSLAKEFYQRYDYGEEFPTLASTEKHVTEEKHAPFTYVDAMERRMLHKAVGGASLDEIKAAGLGYVDTDPDPSPKPGARRLRRYWTRGPGAAKIRWGVAGDFKRCVRQLREHVGAGAEGLCNVYHRSALGHAPGQGPHVGGKSVMYADVESKNLVVEEESLRLENLFLTKKLFEGWERVETKGGQSYDVGFNVLTDAWEAHDAKNFNTIVASADDEAAVYKMLNGM